MPTLFQEKPKPDYGQLLKTEREKEKPLLAPEQAEALESSEEESDDEIDAIKNDPKYKNIMDLLKKDALQKRRDRANFEYILNEKENKENKEAGREIDNFELDPDFKMPKFSKEKISRFSKEYQQSVQEQREFFDYKTKGIFGYDLYRNIQMIKQEPGVAHILGIDEQFINRKIENLRKEFLTILQYPHKRDAFFRFLFEAIYSAQNSLKIREYISEDDCRNNPEKMPQLVSSLPLDIFREMICSHVEWIELMNKRFQAKDALKIKKDILLKIESAINTKQWPLTIEQLKKTVKNVKVMLIDEVQAEIEEIGGKYVPATDIIYLRYGLPLKWEEEVLFHELLHALAGREISKQYDADAPGDAVYQGLKLGLAFQLDTSTTRFLWLDEAWTEELVIEGVQGIEKSHLSCSKNRQLLKLILSKGKIAIPRQIITEAYFENYDPSQKIGKRIPAWQKLYRTVSKAYEPGFLLKIDKIVTQDGTEKAIELLEKY